MTDAVQSLRDARSVLVIDWPSRDVPESLARAGYQVIVKGGPGPNAYRVQELRGGELAAGEPGGAPEHVDIVYAHRPEPELAGIIAGAKQLGAGTLWWQSGRADADTDDPKGCWVSEAQSERMRALAESEGLHYIDDVYIGDAARMVGSTQ